MKAFFLVIIVHLMSPHLWDQSSGIDALIAGYPPRHWRRHLENHDINSPREGQTNRDDEVYNDVTDEEYVGFDKKSTGIDVSSDVIGAGGFTQYDRPLKEGLERYGVSHSSLYGTGDENNRDGNIKDRSVYNKEKRGADHLVDNLRADLIIKNIFPNWHNGSSFDDVTADSDYDRDNGEDIIAIYCPDKCKCEGTKVDCAGQNLTSIPNGINPYTTLLDLSMNSLQKLPEDAFTKLANLKDLRCVGNNLTELPRRLFRNNKLLQFLYFQGNFLKKVPPRTFQNLTCLRELHLDANEIMQIPKNAFIGLSKLKQLWLDDNKLDHVPVAALRELTGLEALTFIKNRITKIPDYAFQNNTKLIQLRLADNKIEDIADHAFYGLAKLKYLQLQNNSISKMTSAFSYLVSLDELNLEYNRIMDIPERSFQMKDMLTSLLLGNNHLMFVAETAFTNLPSLRELKLSEVHDMIRFPDLTGTTNLTVLHLDRAKIRSIPGDVCFRLKKLRNLDVHSNKIRSMPSMSQCEHLTILNMGSNDLASLDGQLFSGMDQLKDLTASSNFIHTLSEDTFVGLTGLEYLNLAKNLIRDIHPNAFLPLKSLKDLNLGENRIHHLPTAGLVSLESLKVFHNPDLREFPSGDQFPNVINFVLTYAYHCCDFIASKPEQVYLDLIREHVIWMEAGEPGQMAIWERYENDSRIWEILTENVTIDKNLWETFARNDYDVSNYHVSRAASTYLEDYQNQDFTSNFAIAKAAISCKPMPGPFMPCDDLFGWWSLRCGVWFVFMLALLGNGAVFFVSVTSKSKMDVPRFLICNLALADFFMGIYLGILAIMDASTLGHFKKYAIQWQMSAGCLIAGTLGVLSSELSVFTLTVITLERFYAITHAMQLNKRLSLKHAGFIMLCGWLWSFGLAILPLFGISDYRKFAVCLPFEIGDIISKSYVCFIMIFNAMSFFIILSCYLIMYISIRQSQAWNSNDTRVAKRMALLVFTDFLCWAPIAFLSLAAAFGKNLIELNEAKVFTIFILPLNSCANPFLYAFFTKQFKKDCVLLCRRFEDSFLAKHFSQVSQRHASLSWKYQRRPSALNSLMGESRSNNSQNNSSGSNVYGVVNYNSEISSETNKASAADALRCDKYLVQSTFHKGKGSSCKILNKHVHKYQPCPTAGNEDYVLKNAYIDVSDDDVDKENVQAVLHQDSYPFYGPEMKEFPAESYVDDNDVGCQFIPSSQKHCNGLSEEGSNVRANGGLQCPSIVIYEDNSTPVDESQDHLWIWRSLQNIDSEQDKDYVEVGHSGLKICQEKQKSNKFPHENKKNMQVEKQNSKHPSTNEDLSSSLATSADEINGRSPTKFSMTDSNLTTSDDPGREKVEDVSDKQKISEIMDGDVPPDAHEVKTCQSKQGNWRENLQCCITDSSPSEQRDCKSDECRKVNCSPGESEPCFLCKTAQSSEQPCDTSHEDMSDHTKKIKKGRKLDKNVTLTTDGNHLEAPPAAIAFTLKREMIKRTNSLVRQQKFRNVTMSLHPRLYARKSLNLTSPTVHF